MRLLEIPKAALQVSAVKPSAENADRLGKFWAFYDAPSSDSNMRTAVLCLRLTEYALNISSAKHTSSRGVPTLVRLARGEVQEQTQGSLQTSYAC